MDKKMELFHRMIKIENNIIQEDFYAKNYLFYDFMDDLELNKNEYEKLLFDLHKKEFITINMNKEQDFNYATIRATTKAAQEIIKQNEEI